MLQQTQVARVVERYAAWLARWPSADVLAAAPRADVIAAWVGLGYNTRAVRLWEACRIVAAGGWPEDLLSLPGVGPYTAAAVGSFAFGRDEVAVDVNARRVFARFGGMAGAGPDGAPGPGGPPSPGDPPDPSATLAPAAGGAAAFNQATMELGATICTARAPRCGQCPLAGACPARGAASPVAAPARNAVRRERFEDTNRYVRGRVVAAFAAGEGLPAGIDPERVGRAVDGLVRDGVVVRDPAGLSLG